MAVTQQLVSVTLPTLVACRASVDLLDQVCCYDSSLVVDELDLDWAPSPLEQAAVLADLDDELVGALTRSTEGDVEVNPAYRDHPDTIWEHPVSALEPDAVRLIASALAALEALDIFSEEPGRRLDLHVTFLDSPASPHQYLREKLADLAAFYGRAAAGNLAVVMWWD